MRISIWNILADGLSTGEFLTKDDVQWCNRRHRIVSMIDKLSVDLIATVENDHPLWILNELKEKDPRWKAVIFFKGEHGTLKYTTCRKLRSLDPKITFKDEASSVLASLYDCVETDSYRCDDTMTVYYNSEKYHTPLYIGYTPNDYCQIPMIERDTNKTFNLIVAHLKSGESYLAESLRVTEMNKMFTNISDDTIILMDSNNSVYYESQYDGLTVSQTVRNHNFVILDNPSGQCFKLRHSKGDQPSKFGQLMFDTIDKIIIPRSATGTIVNEYEILSAKDIELATLLRLKYRSIIRELCIEQWTDTINSIDFEVLYDRLQLPKQYSLKDLIDLFNKLYPNEYMPSDHPPLVAEIQFNKSHPIARM
jgi:hypothetical protein